MAKVANQEAPCVDGASTQPARAAAAPAGVAPRGPRVPLLGRWSLGGLVLPISIVVVLVVWEGYVAMARPPSYLLPAPSRIGQALLNGLSRGLDDRSGYWLHLGSTLRGALSGYVLGCSAGILLGVLISEFRVLEHVLLPYAVGLQSLPKVAIAPLILIWFGFGPSSKMVLAALLTFFPLLINSYVGLNLVERDYILLMRSLRASRLQVLRKVKLPGALPMIFAGLDMSAVYAVLGAIVAEFVGSDAGIGVMIIQAQFQNDTASVFAALVVLAILGIFLHTLVQTVGHRLVFWTRVQDQIRVTS